MGANIKKMENGNSLLPFADLWINLDKFAGFVQENIFVVLQDKENFFVQSNQWEAIFLDLTVSLQWLQTTKENEVLLKERLDF